MQGGAGAGVGAGLGPTDSSDAANLQGWKYVIQGKRDQVEKLVKAINDYSQNPQNFFCSVEFTKPHIINDNFIANLKQSMQNKFNGVGDLVELKKLGHDKISIKGFKSK